MVRLIFFKVKVGIVLETLLHVTAHSKDLRKCGEYHDVGML